MMRDTIRHDDTRTIIRAYLATRPVATRTAQIVAYMRLMHRTSGNATKIALHRMLACGQVEQVQFGWYVVPGPAPLRSDAELAQLCRQIAAGIIANGVTHA